MDLKRQEENFKNHVATFVDYGNIKILDFMILDFTFPTTPSNSPLHRGRNERKERYNVSMQRILPLGKGKPEGG